MYQRWEETLEAAMKSRLLVGILTLFLTPSTTLAEEKGIPVHGYFYISGDEWATFSATVETNSPREALWGGMLTMRGFAEWTREAKRLAGTVILPGGERLVTYSADSRNNLAGIKDPAPAETSEHKLRNFGAVPIFNFK